MAKPIIGWALVRTSSYAARAEYAVLGVVSEARRILYGRWADDDTVTNVSERDAVLRYDSEEQARAAIAGVAQARAEHLPLIRAAEQAVHDAREAQKTAIRKAAVAART